jgi:hypothetical protein
VFKKYPRIITDTRVGILLSRIPERFRWVSTGVMLCLIAGIWGVVWYLPTLRRMSACEQAVRDAKKVVVLLQARSCVQTQPAGEGVALRRFNPPEAELSQDVDEVRTVGVVCVEGRTSKLVCCQGRVDVVHVGD